MEYAGGPFGGDSQFVKYFLNAKAFYPVTASTVFSWNVLWGARGPDGGRTERSRMFERFFLGGPYSIRGFRSRDLSPRDPNTGELIGGNKELIANLEYLFPLVPEIGVQGSLLLRRREHLGAGDVAVGTAGSSGTPTGSGCAGTPRWGRCGSSGDGTSSPGPGKPKRVMEFTIGTAF